MSKQTKSQNPFGVSTGADPASGLETPQFNSQQSYQSSSRQDKKTAPSKGGHTPSSASYLLELQHSQITEVNSEYEVTQNDRNGRHSITP